MGDIWHNAARIGQWTWEKKKTNRREFRGQQYKLLGMWKKNIKGKKKLRQHSDTGLEMLNAKEKKGWLSILHVY